MAGMNSAAFLAIAKIANDKKKLFMAAGSGTARLTNEECSPYAIHYGYDTVALAKGMYLADSWCLDENDESGAWAKRYFAKIKKMPTGLHVSGYSATLQYLKAVKAAGTDDADKVIAQLKSGKISDMYVKNTYVRDDGRLVHDMYLMQVKKPGESKYPWDYCKVMETIPGEQAFTTKAESKCVLWK